MILRGHFKYRHLTDALACRAVHDGESIPFGVVGDLHNLLLELLELQVQVAALRVVIGVVDCLDGQFTHALHHVCDFVGRAFCRLDQVNGITRITHGLVQAANLLRHSGGNGHTGGVISC